MTQARDLEAAAARRLPDDPDAMQAHDMAADLRADAEAIATALEHMGGVFIPAPGQLSLFSDGGPQA
jgi:hypothetical protein